MSVRGIDTVLVKVREELDAQRQTEKSTTDSASLM